MIDFPPALLRRALVALGLSAVLFFVVIAPASAKDDDPLPPSLDALPPAQSSGAGGQSNNNHNDNSEGGGNDIIRYITQIFHIVNFPDADIDNWVAKIAYKNVANINTVVVSLLSQSMAVTVSGPYGMIGQTSNASIFQELVRPGWNTSLTIAIILLPAVLALSLVLAMRNGLESVMGFADMREGITSWFVSAVLAGGSYHVIWLFHRLSMEIAKLFLGSVTVDNFLNALLNTVVLNSAITSLSSLLSGPTAGAIAGLVVFTFAIVLGVAIFGALALAGAAYVALVVIFSVIAPLVLVISSVPALHWLRMTWLRAITIVLMLAPLNALLIALTVTLLGKTETGGGAGGWVGGLLVALSAMSLLLTMNYKAGEFAFGAVMEIAKGVLSSVASVGGAALGLGVGLAGAAVGVPALGNMMSGSMSNAANSAANSLSGSSNNNGASPLASDSDPTSILRGSQAAGAMGRALAMSGNPFARSVGAGLMGGAAVQGADAGLRMDRQREAEAQATQGQRQEQSQAAYSSNVDRQTARGESLLARSRTSTRNMITQGEGGESIDPNWSPRQLAYPQRPAADVFAERMQMQIKRATGEEGSYVAARHLGARLDEAIQSRYAGQNAEITFARQELYKELKAGDIRTPSNLNGNISAWATRLHVPLNPAETSRDVQEAFPRWAR